jgi:hypothetical protein
MNHFLKICAGLMVALSLSACSSSQMASLAAMPDDTMLGFTQPDFSIDSFTVSVPKSLKVNDKNLYYPRGDIVWRGDLPGDRHAQVKAIIEAGLRNAAPRLTGTRPVRIDVQVLRFHGLSEKARYTVGGVHNITMMYRLIDVSNGLQIGPTKTLQADLDALGGQAAIDADSQGRTQKARIVTHLAKVFTTELSEPGGYQNAKLGLFQQINDL